MKWFTNLKLSRKLQFIIFIFAFGIIIFGLTSFNTIEKIRINGNMYSQIIQGKDLIADILPPSDYIVESYLNAFQILNENSADTLQQLIAKSKDLRHEYEVRHDYWAKVLPQSKMKDYLIDKSYHPAIDFYDLRDNKFIPLVLSGRKKQAEQLLNGQMKQKYKLHKSYIDKVVKLAAAQDRHVENDAKDIIYARKVGLIIIGITILLILFFVVSQMFKNITKPINKVLTMAKELSLGHVKARSNIDSNDEIGILAKTMDGMAQNLDAFASKLHRIALGDVSVISNSSDENDLLAPALNAISSTLKNLINEISKLTKAALEGKLNEHGDESRFKGGYKEIISGVNATLDAMVKPIKEANEVLGILAKGDLTIRIINDYEGDFSIFKNSINGLAVSFNEAITNVMDAVQATASVSNEISSSTEEMAAGSSEQSQQSREIAGAIEEMTKTILETTKNASSAATAAQEAGNTAKEDGAVVKETIKGMNRIAEVVRKSAQTVQELGKGSDQIGEIVQVIDDIADQTNLLALNAAIEAARAGEQGRGFAVVADEVRKLAERTTKATKEIAEMIKKIQKDTGEAVRSMTEGTAEVENGIQLADKAGKSLEEIIEGSNRVVDIATQVAAASEEQSSASEQISKNIESIANVTNQNAAEIQQVTRSSEDLSRLTENLRELISQFKINERTKKSNMEDIGEDEKISKSYIRHNGKIVHNQNDF